MAGEQGDQVLHLPLDHPLQARPTEPKVLQVLQGKSPLAGPLRAVCCDDALEQVRWTPGPLTLFLPESDLRYLAMGLCPRPHHSSLDMVSPAPPAEQVLGQAEVLDGDGGGVADEHAEELGVEAA